MSMHAGDGAAKMSDSDRDETFLKRYLQYARSHCFPRLSAESAAHLQNEYVSIRKQVRSRPTMRTIPVHVESWDGGMCDSAWAFARWSLTKKGPQHL